MKTAKLNFKTNKRAKTKKEKNERKNISLSKADYHNEREDNL